jgi:acetyl-CoA carboxylase biotin carboxyl carrier protein
MIDLEFLERLIQALDRSGLDTVEIERGGTRVRLSRSASVAVSAPSSGAAPVLHAAAGALTTPASPPAASVAAAEGGAAKSNLIEITSPMVGTFFRAPAPDAPSYVERGARIAKGDALCIIEAMKLMNELESEVDGIIVDILVENAQPVEYGQVLFRVEPA